MDQLRDAAMAEELHTAAMAYFENGSDEQKAHAWQFFNTMDINDDGHVSIEEYINFLNQNEGLAWVPQETFQLLDRNRDGQLEFSEVLTLYYVAKTRTIYCRKCCKPLNGLYFTCVTCFDATNCVTFDLCSECYTEKKYVHEHCFFLDSYVLLRSRRNNFNQQQQQQQLVIYHNPENPVAQQQPSILGWRNALKLMEVSLAVGNYAGLCNIM